MRARSVGFTLAEMAIVLLVVGLLLGGMLSTVSTQIDGRNNRDTLARLEQIKEALIGFAQANGRLPCSADGTLATGAAGAGVEPAMVSNACPTLAKYAVLPWITLGLPETDVWGRRFTYFVDASFADLNAKLTWTAACGAAPVPVPVAPTSFALCSTGSLSVVTKTPSNKTPTPTSGIPAVIISHGRNGYGAYTSSGQLYGVLPATTTDEYGNTPTAATSTFYSREQSPQPSGSCSDTAAGVFCEFDDLVAYIPVSVLVTRMVAAGRLP